MPVALDSSAQETYGSLFPQKSEEGKQKWLLHQVGAPKGETIPDSTSNFFSLKPTKNKSADCFLCPL